MAIRHLTSLLPFCHPKVIMNLACPGLCKTDLSRSVSLGYARSSLSKKRNTAGQPRMDLGRPFKALLQAKKVMGALCLLVSLLSEFEQCPSYAVILISTKLGNRWGRKELAEACLECYCKWAGGNWTWLLGEYPVKLKLLHMLTHLHELWEFSNRPLILKPEIA